MRITTRQILIWGLATLVWQLSLSGTVQASPHEPQFRAFLVGITKYAGDLETLEGENGGYSVKAAVPELYLSLKTIAEREFAPGKLKINAIIDYDPGGPDNKDIVSMDEVRQSHLGDSLTEFAKDAFHEDDV